jgi:hypothetical protein
MPLKNLLFFVTVNLVSMEQTFSRYNLILDAFGKSDYFIVVVVCSLFTRWVQQVKLLFKKPFKYV